MRLELRGVSKSFAGHQVLNSVSAVFPDARALVFIGPSGGGKSTLLRLIAGLEVPDSGSIFVDDVPIDFSSESSLRRHRLQMGIVFQAYNLFPHLSAIQNVQLPLERVHGHSAASAEIIASSALSALGLRDHMHKRPAELSGGQQQRVALARATAFQPRILLLDEPTSALDPEMTAEILDSIERLKDEGRSFILVTHAMGFARRVADVVAFVARGTILEYGPSESLFALPSSSDCRSFLNRVLRY